MGLLDRIASLLPGRAASVALPEPTLPMLERAGDPESRAWMERALVQGDLGITAVSMSGAQPPQRRGNIEAMRAYSTGPWLRGVVGRIASACASVHWKLFVAPAVGTASRARMRFDEMRASGWRSGAFPPELEEAYGEERATLVRDMHIAGELMEVQRHPWHALMRTPNTMMSGRVAREVIVSSHAIVGDAAFVLGSDGGPVPQRMWPIPGVWIQRRPTISEPWWVIQIGAGSSSANATLWTVPWDALLLFNDPDPLQPYGRGIGLGYTLGDEVDIDEGAAKVESAFFHNNAMPNAIASFKGAKGGALEKVKRDWNNKFQGFKKAYSVLFTGGDIDVKRLDTNFTDMNIVELRKAQRDIFTQVFGIPPEIMGNNETSSWATSSASEAIFAKHAMIPRLEVMREQFQRLAHLFDPRLVVEYVNPVPADKEHSLKVMEKFPAHFRVNEVRALANQGPTGDLAGDGFIDKDGTWWANLTQLSPKSLPVDVTGGTYSVDERRQYLRLPALGAEQGGNEPTPRRAQKTGDVTPTDPELDNGSDVTIAPTPDAADDTPKPESDTPGAQQPTPEEKQRSQDEWIASMPSGPRLLALKVLFDAGGVWAEQARRVMKLIERDAPQEPAAVEKTHLTPDEIRHICMGVDAASMFDAIHEPVKAAVTAYGQHTLDGMDLDDEHSFDTDSQIVRKHTRELGTHTVPQINATTRDRLKDAMHVAERLFHQGSTTAQQVSAPSARAGTDTNGGLFYDAIMAGIREVFGDAAMTRSDQIGTTEGTRASTVGVDAAIDQAPDEVSIRKTWIAVMDADTRDTHMDLDGQEVDPDEDFVSFTGASAPGPGMFGIAEEDINCRCVTGTVIGAANDMRLAAGHTAEHRRAAHQAAQKVIQPHREAIARATRDGFDRQYVRVVAALNEVLKAY